MKITRAVKFPGQRQYESHEIAVEIDHADIGAQSPTSVDEMIATAKNMLREAEKSLIMGLYQAKLVTAAEARARWDFCAGKEGDENGGDGKSGEQS